MIKRYSTQRKNLTYITHQNLLIHPPNFADFGAPQLQAAPQLQVSVPLQGHFFEFLAGISKATTLTERIAETSKASRLASVSPGI